MALYPINEAITLARSRGILPTALSSAELRDSLRLDVKRRSVFSARTTNLTYLSKQRQIIADHLAGKIDKAQARLRLKQILALLGYDAEAGGFPEGDPVPPAFRGTLQDLASDSRLNLILDTQWGLMHGAARHVREREPERFVLFPAWELKRKSPVTTPRGQKRDRQGRVSPDPQNAWEARWKKAGGKVVNGRLVAWKWDKIWQNLGNSDLFKDGLDSKFTPYWFSSEAGIFEVSKLVAERLLGKMPILKGGPADVSLPVPTIKLDKLPEAAKKDLKTALKAIEAKGNLTLESIMKRGQERLQAQLKEQDAAKAPARAKWAEFLADAEPEPVTPRKPRKEGKR